VPTFTEAGLPGFSLRPWQGVLAPARTPRPIIDRLSGEIARIIALPDIKERLVSLGMQPLISTPEQFAALMADDMAKSSAVVRTANIALE
jgi:tripartite-type tricarboxylate transporter receptor subunit TctC